MTSKMESLKEKLARLQAEIEAEAVREAQEAAAVKIRDAFTEAIRDTVARVEQGTGESLKAIGLGIWVAYSVDSTQESVLDVSARAVGLDGFPTGATARVIPPRSHRNSLREYDTHLYRERNLVECFINKVKHYRHIFSRFDKLASRYLGFLSLVGALIWLR